MAVVEAAGVELVAILILFNLLIPNNYRNAQIGTNGGC